MVSFKTILVPTDFSEPARKALAYGLRLGDQFRAKVVIAHIVSGTDEISPGLEDSIRNEIEQLILPADACRSSIQVIVKSGRIDAELIGIVAKEEVDLVVMGTHGRRNLGKWFIGSVTEHMLRKLPVPLITVSHCEEERYEMGFVGLDRVLYATDSEVSTKSLRYAIALAHSTGAHLTMMHAVYYPDRLLWAPAGIPGFEEYQAELSQRMRSSAQEVLMEEGLSGLPIETLIVEGKPFEKILEVAEERKMDIIVLNLQSRSTLDRAFLGSTAERVVRLAQIPVLSIPIALTPEKERSSERAVEAGVAC